MRQRTNCCYRQSALVELALDWKERSTFNPSVSYAKVFRKSVRIVRRSQEFIRLSDVLPICLRKLHVTARRYIIVRRNNIKRRCVGRGVRVRIALEPIHETRALRDLVRNLSVLTLKLRNKFQRGLGGRKIAFA